MRKRVKDNWHYLGFEIALENLKGFVRKSNRAEDKAAEAQNSPTGKRSQERFDRPTTDSDRQNPPATTW